MFFVPHSHDSGHGFLPKGGAKDNFPVPNRFSYLLRGKKRPEFFYPRPGIFRGFKLQKNLPYQLHRFRDLRFLQRPHFQHFYLSPP